MLLDDGFESKKRFEFIRSFFFVMNIISLLFITYFVFEAFVNKGLGSIPKGNNKFQDDLILLIHNILFFGIPFMNCIYSLYLLFCRFLGRLSIGNYKGIFIVCAPWLYWIIFILGLGPWIE